MRKYPFLTGVFLLPLLVASCASLDASSSEDAATGSCVPGCQIPDPPSDEGEGGSGLGGDAGLGDPDGNPNTTGGSSGSKDPPSLPLGPCRSCADALCVVKGVGDCECAQGVCKDACAKANLGFCPEKDGGYGGVAGSGGQAGTGPPGTGGSGVAGTGGSPASGMQRDDCSGINDATPNKNDCSDDACVGICADMCLAPPELWGSQVGSLEGHSSEFKPSCAPSSKVGSSIAYRYTAPESGWLRLKLSSPDDMVLSVFRGPCASGSYAYCSNTTGVGGSEQLSIEVKQGEDWFVVVTAAKKNGAVFSLTSELDVPVCGDGKKSDNEKCDDGNVFDDDGCSSDCQINACESAGTLSDLAVEQYSQVPAVEFASGKLVGSGSPLQSSCVQPGSSSAEQIHSIRAANPGRLEVQLTPKSAELDLVLSAWSSCALGAELQCVDGAQGGGVERLSLPAEAGQTFYLFVEGYSSQDQGDYEIRAQTLPVACGDGIVVKSVEQCDPKDDENEKSCSDQCIRVIAQNNSLGPGVVAKVPALDAQGQAQVWGEIFPAGDADLFAVTVPDGKSLRVSTGNPTQETDCTDLRLDSQLEALDSSGNLVAFNDDDAKNGYCSTLTLAQPGNYTIRVRSSVRSAPAQVFSYQLGVTAF